MNKVERIKMLKAMEFIARQINDEELFMDNWLVLGVADGDIEYGDLSIKTSDEEDLDYYMEDETFSDLMDTFLYMMHDAYKDGGLYCDNVVSKSEADFRNSVVDSGGNA